MSKLPDNLEVKLLQCRAALVSLRRDYEKQYAELTKLRVELAALKAGKP